MDHWGLIDELATHWPIHAGAMTAELMRLSAGLFGDMLARPIVPWGSRSVPIQLGAFKSTPYLTDHSAPDVYMLLVEGAGRRVLYSGDFPNAWSQSQVGRGDDLAAARCIDVLVMEGTNLGTNKPVLSEAAL